MKTATFTAGPSRELFNMFPKHWTERAKTNERQWREQMERDKRRIVTDTRELNRF